MVNNCEGCLEKQRKIDQLLEEVQRLKAKLRYQERKDKEGFFGLSTPSSQLPLKANTDQENRNHRGEPVQVTKGMGENLIPKRRPMRSSQSTSGRFVRIVGDG